MVRLHQWYDNLFYATHRQSCREGSWLDDDYQYASGSGYLVLLD